MHSGSVGERRAVRIVAAARLEGLFVSVPSTLSQSTPVPAPRRPGPSRAARLLTLPEVRWAALATALFALGGLCQVAGAPAGVWWVLYLACYAAGGWEPARAGLEALRAKTLDVDLLMIVAALVAAGIGQVFDGALLIVIFATSGALEAVATARTADSVRALLDLTPDRALVVDADGTQRDVPAADLVVGDVVLVRPGERITADGEVVGGSSDVDQASITGEPMPVAKGAGDDVFAGTVNGNGALQVRVTRDPAQWVLARIVTLVEQASATKARTQLFIEKVEQRYSVGVVVATLALFLVPLALGADLRTTLLRAMTFMIVASPCAVVLATMPPLLSAIANAGRHGVLVKSAVVLEQLGHVDTVVFDKTGTLTAGRPVLTEVAVLPGAALTTADVLRLAAAVERSSEHPLGTAVVTAARERGLDIPAATQFRSVPGRGVHAVVDGRTVSVGTARLLDDPSGMTAQQAADAGLAGAEAAGHTPVLVLVDGRPAGVLTLADRIRPEAHAAVGALRRSAGKVVMLTGDNPGAAARIGRTAGIDDVRAGLLPEAKVDAVRELEASAARVLAIGDGINDAAMLAAAHTGVAMGGAGSDLTLESADVVLVRDDLSTVATVVELSRRARRVVIANLAIAAAVITGLVIWDLVGHLPLPLGVAGHEGSTVVVGLNGLRLLRAAAWRRAGRLPD